MKRGKAPTAEQERFHDWVAEQGCWITGSPANIHHCVGSTAKFNKIHIGQWWVIPLCYDAHQGPHGIHGDREIFNPDMPRKELEKEIFKALCMRLPKSTVPDEVYDAIMEYSR